MEEQLEQGILWTSVLCLVAAALLIPLGFLGIPATLLVVLALLVLAGGLFAGRDHTDEYGRYLQWLWVAPLLAAVVATVGVLIGASADELQALGGLVGLLGVANILLRPVYQLGYYVLSVTLRFGRKLQQGGR